MIDDDAVRLAARKILVVALTCGVAVAWPTVWTILGGLLVVVATSVSWLETYNDLEADRRRRRMRNLLSES